MATSVVVSSSALTDRDHCAQASQCSWERPGKYRASDSVGLSPLVRGRPDFRNHLATHLAPGSPTSRVPSRRSVLQDRRKGFRHERSWQNTAGNVVHSVADHRIASGRNGSMALRAGFHEVDSGLRAEKTSSYSGVQIDHDRPPSSRRPPDASHRGTTQLDLSGSLPGESNARHRP